MGEGKDKMKANYIGAFMAMALVLLGMAGLYFRIEYSGWVLFVGLLAIFCV
jgi:hypothetical protein